jgi:hypothetical protein
MAEASPLRHLLLKALCEVKALRATLKDQVTGWMAGSPGGAGVEKRVPTHVSKALRVVNCRAAFQN